MGRWFIFLLFLVVCQTQALGANLVRCKAGQCIAVIDAGSTGSRVHIYAFERKNNHLPTNVKEIWSKKIKPGIASIEASQFVIDRYLNHLFEDAPVDSLPVYFYATAGMRLKSQPKQRTIYKQIRKWFQKNDDWTLKEAKTITGKEEALFGWLAVNQQLNRLNEPKKNLVSVMDMGGASVEIAFPLQYAENISTNDIYEINLNGQRIKLFAKSFLGLGQNTLSQQFLNEASCFAKNYMMPDGNKAKGDAVICKNKVAKLINEVHEVKKQLKSTKMQSIHSWYVIGGLSYLVHDKPFGLTGDTISSKETLDFANINICRQPWSTVKKYSDNEYTYGYCMFSSYYYALIVEGYGLEPEEPLHFLSIDKNSDWTLGVVLHRA